MLYHKKICSDTCCRNVILNLLRKENAGMIFLRFGRSQNFKYKDQFINMIIENNSTVSASWIRSVLKNTDAWYLPISQGEIDSNPNLIQNPYYDVTAN